MAVQKISQPPNWFDSPFEVATKVTQVTLCFGREASKDEEALCPQCGETVHARPMVTSSKTVEHFLPVDERGWCPMCRWMEGTAEAFDAERMLDEIERGER